MAEYFKAYNVPKKLIPLADLSPDPGLKKLPVSVRLYVGMLF